MANTSDLIERIESLEKRIKNIENQLKTGSEIKCPKCGEYQFFVEQSYSTSQGKRLGIHDRRDYKCKSCGFEETQIAPMK